MDMREASRRTFVKGLVIGGAAAGFGLWKPPAWASTMSLIRKERAARIRVTHEKPSASSYENICAEERSPPRSEYLLLAAQPARTTP